MAINKVIYDNQTLVDLTADTVTADTLAAGVTAHDKSGASIVGTAYKNSYYVKGTQTASTNVWTGDLSEVDELYDGLAIDYFLPFPGTSSAATLNLTLKDGTKTGAIPVYRDGTNTFTNNVGGNQIIRLIYHSVTISGTVRTGWRIIRTQDNNDAANRIYNGSSAYQANSAVYRYQLLFQVDENKLTPLNNVNNSQATNKTMLTGVDFLPFGKIFYYNSTTNIAANGNMTSALNNRANFDLRYSLNSGTTLTAHRDIYLKCVKQSNGKFRITADPCWTQSLPSTADGYYYLRLGRTYSTSNMYLDEDHPIYYHNGTEVVQYTQLTASTTSIGSASTGTAIPADDITAWSAGSVPTLTYDEDEEGVIFTAGTAPSLSYTAKSIPNISVSRETVVAGIKVAA